jgi:D-sedoheptulose 7-phosphate isomerase
MNLEKEISERMRALSALIGESLPENLDKLRQASEKIADALKRGNKVLFFGNGGSAAEAQHFAAEFVNRMVMERPPLAALALTTDSSVLTSIGNDRGFDDIFALQVRALGKKGDLAVGISTSGNSPNVIRALELCGEMGIYRIGLAGRPKERIGEVCELCFWVKSQSTARIQEMHLLIGHLICEMVDLIFFGDK